MNGWNDSLRTNYYRHPALVPPMPWLNNDAPDQPSIIQKSNNATITYNGHLKIKGFGIFSVPLGKEVKFINSQLLQIIVTNKEANINLNNVPDVNGNKLYIATIDINNNVSALKELK